jgi:hypothetical protein
VSAAKTLKPRPLLARDVQVYRLCEALTEALIYLMAVFSPWAFGTTDDWAMWVMNFGGYGLGLLLATKLAIRWLKGYRPPRWEKTQGEEPRRRNLTIALAALTVAIPVYCLIGALNARATYHRSMLGFEYHEYLKWLPASFDSNSTWFVFWCSLSLACSVWAVRDWLLGKSTSEERAQWLSIDAGQVNSAPVLPGRFRRLLWVLTINGGLLAAEGIIQRLANCPRLLFLVLPPIHQTADTQFGPYAYRSNAAQYFNLLWPISLGFWWVLRLTGGSNRKAQHLPLICAAIMAACPIISTTRGGALVAFGQLIVATIFLAASELSRTRGLRVKESTCHAHAPMLGWWQRTGTAVTLGLFLMSSLTLGLGLGWKTLKPRMARIEAGYEDRERTYQNAHPMAEDYPVYGIGPGAFVYVFQLYRVSTQTFWPAELHNDWLETRISFGWAGSGLIALALGLVLLSWFLPGGLAGQAPFTVMLWLAMAGCLVHARFDFPFKVYSVVFLFLIWCAMLLNVSRKSGPIK